MESQFTYEETLRVAEGIRWRVEDIIGGENRLDFGRPFLPDALARTAELDFLGAGERRTLNQIRGHAYLNIFGLVEEFILPFVLDHARPRLGADDHQVRALLQFASEEAKHIHLFRRFRDEFEEGFGARCEVIGPPADVAQAVLAHHPLAVALTILHIEWMTQRHWVESVRDEGDLDPQFKSLLRHHWMEEAQHAKLDTLMVEALAAAASPDEVERALDEYLEIGGMLDVALGRQVELDLESLERAAGCVLAGEERARAEAVQRRANRWTYLGSGMTHPRFLASVGRLRPGARARIESVAAAFC